MVAHELCGALVMLNYSNMIFNESGLSFSVGLCEIITCAIGLIGSIVSASLIDHLGRKVLTNFHISIFGIIKLQNFQLYSIHFSSLEQLLMVISFAGMAICYAVMGTYSFIARSTDIDMKPYNGLLLIAFSTMLFLAACGALSIPQVMPSDILPHKVSLMKLQLVKMI